MRITTRGHLAELVNFNPNVDVLRGETAWIVDRHVGGDRLVLADERSALTPPLMFDAARLSAGCAPAVKLPVAIERVSLAVGINPLIAGLRDDLRLSVARHVRSDDAHGVGARNRGSECRRLQSDCDCRRLRRLPAATRRS